MVDIINSVYIKLGCFDIPFDEQTVTFGKNDYK